MAAPPARLPSLVAATALFLIHAVTAASSNELSPHMRGGGSLEARPVAIGASLWCDPGRPGNELQVTWAGALRTTFHLKDVETVICGPLSGTPRGGGTHHGEGSGTCHSTGRPVPARAAWELTDSGASGEPDAVRIDVLGPGQCRLDAAGPLDDGELRFTAVPS